ncbi:MAG: hypothetical protein LBQ15_01825 [Clostridium sp.]|nr:hypothetical protein [Clostridium sp.]
MGQEQNNTKRRKRKQISEPERYKIEALSEQGLTPAQIGETLEPKRDRRTIEREPDQGFVEQKRMNPSNKKYEPLYIVERVYKADAAQRRREETSANKGRGLKIGHDHKLARYIEDRIKNERWSPDAIIGHIKAEGLPFKASICTKTLYSYIDSGVFAGISNKDLWVKEEGKKRGYKKIRTVALNNRNGKSITERPPEADGRRRGIGRSIWSPASKGPDRQS